MANTIILKLTNNEVIIADLLDEDEMMDFTGETSKGYPGETEAHFIAFRCPLKIDAIDTRDTITFIEWNPYTDDEVHTLPKQHILSVSNPTSDLFESYADAVQQIYGVETTNLKHEDINIQQLRMLETLDKTSGEQ